MAKVACLAFCCSCIANDEAAAPMSALPAAKVKEITLSLVRASPSGTALRSPMPASHLYEFMAHLYGPAARCKPKVTIWRGWSCTSVSGLTSWYLRQLLMWNCLCIPQRNSPSQLSLPSLPRAHKKVPVGCDTAFSSVSSPQFATVYGRCLV